MRKINVVERVAEGEKPIPVEIMAEAIIAISMGIKKLRSTRLNDKALHLLIQHATPLYPKITIREIKAVLEGIQDLERMYLKKP